MKIDEAISQATDMLHGVHLAPAQVLDVVKDLHKDRKFGLARKVLDR